MRRYTGPRRLSSGAAMAYAAASEPYRLSAFMIHDSMINFVQTLLRLPLSELFSPFPAFLFPDIPIRERGYCHGKRKINRCAEPSRRQAVLASFTFCKRTTGDDGTITEGVPLAIVKGTPPEHFF